MDAKPTMSESRLSTVAAISARSFTESIGVNTHLGWLDTPNSDVKLTIGSLRYLGVDRIRDLTPVEYMLPAYQEIALAGIKFDLIFSGNDQDVLSVLPGNLNLIKVLERSNPGSILSIEGPNELNEQVGVTYNGTSASNPNASVARQIVQAISAGVRSDPVLGDVPVVNVSLSNGIDGWKSYLAGLGDLSGSVDSGNWHVYFNNGAQPGSVLNSMLLDALQAVPGKPVTVTESGYFSADKDTSGWGGVDQITQAKNTLNLLADAAQAGVQATYLYELMEGIPDPSDTDVGNTFGLFHSDGSPKPVATAIHDLTTILTDTDLSAASFKTQSLSFAASNLPAGGNTLLLQKANGVFDLLVWAEPKNWDPVAQAAINIPASAVNITFGSAYDTINVYDPLQSDAPVKTVTNTSSIVLPLADHLMVVEVLPGTTAVSTSQGASTPGAPAGDVLAVNLSEDAWHGDAQFTVSVDGHELDGVQTVTALHVQGASQQLSFNVSLGTGTHDVTISFLNDAYGGTAATDRNLYVDSLALNGSAVPESQAILYSAGSKAFTLPAIKSGTDSLTVQLAEDAYGGDAKVRIELDGKLLVDQQTVTAAHGLGAWQSLTFKGAFGPAAHDIAVSFLNDAYGGTSATDRNLYVGGISFDGTSHPSAAATLYLAETVHFHI